MNLSEQLVTIFTKAGLKVIGAHYEPVYDFQLTTSDYRLIQFNFNREGSVLENVIVDKTQDEKNDEEFLDEVGCFFDENEEVFDAFKYWANQREKYKE